jgi:hypothetical protein
MFLAFKEMLLDRGMSLPNLLRWLYSLSSSGEFSMNGHRSAAFCLARHTSVLDNTNANQKSILVLSMTGVVGVMIGAW